MAEKRRASGRIRSDAPPRKKRQSLSVSVPEPVSKEASETPSNVIESIPSKFIEGQHLPTIARDALLPDVPLQSIIESGVLQASLRKSRNAWLNDNIFERYWTKPTKKKGQLENPNNPPKESMQKTGLCRIIIEPHVFQATLYAIRKWPAAAVPGPQSQTLVPTFPAQAASSTSNTLPTVGSFPATPAPAPSSQAPVPGAVVASSFPSSTQVPPGSIQNAAITNNATPSGVSASTPSSTTFAPPGSSTTTPVAPKPNQDPVIQMLAQRASTNSELKVLMKIVAAGNATTEQLKVFQSHIDELTAILHRQTQLNHFVQMGPQASSTNLFRNTPASTSSPFRPLSYGQPPKYQPVAQAKPKPPPAPKVDITGVAIEFAGYPAERYLFPRHSVVEPSADGKQLTVSFLVVKSSGANDNKLDDSKTDKSRVEHYQPVTMRLIADHSRAFDSIYKTVAAPDEAVKHMENIMAATQRAEDVKLVMRLTSTSDNNAISEDAHPGTPLTSGRRKSGFEDDTPASTTRVSRKKSDDQERRCQCCFAALPPRKEEQAQTLCSECAALGMPGSTRVGRPNLELTRSHQQHSQRAGPRALMLAGTAY